MKVCPQCQKTYDDETLNFCLDDGAVLTLNNASSGTSPEAVNVGEPAATEFHSPFARERNWKDNPNYRANSGSSSKSMLWVVGILFAVMLFCGSSGVVGLFIIGSMDDDLDAPTRTGDVNDDNSRKFVKEMDFSNVAFESNESIKVKSISDELVLSTNSGYFYLFIFDNFITKDSNIKLTVQNKTGKATNYGFGLVINSDPDKPVEKDYAFLIDSKTGQYRFVEHKAEEELSIIDWQKSSAIKKGTSPNDLEVRVYESNVDLYINNEFIQSVDSDTPNSDVVAGVYTSDAVPITFTNMELWK